MVQVGEVSEAVARTAGAGGPSFYERRGKRVLDLALGVPLAVIALPLIVLLAALVFLSSGWSPLYAASRAGRDGVPFRVLKLRSMRRGADAELAQCLQDPALAAEYAARFKLRDDPRVTPLGRILRRTSLDELPQLFNVIRGQMSLVGPRPYFERELEQFPDHRGAILSVRPGLTGPWQVRGRNDILPEGRVKIDAEYAANCTLRGDLVYLIQTIPPILRLNGQ